TLLSSQGTDASFVLTRDNLSGFPPGSFPSVLRFQPYQTVFRSVSGQDFDPVAVEGALPIRLPSGSLSASPTLSEVFGRTNQPFIPE
ncbi:hypothetical protein ACH4TV_40140, partial [Streptomyces sp. NPDC020898]|uniref:hypothetical protein n=1 Tax=Streptomyces sp. NPDC020898 TaxID=3365101 RepID=UPI00378A94AC